MLDAALVFLAAAVAVADVAFLGTRAFAKKGKRGTSPEGHIMKSLCDNFTFLLFVTLYPTGKFRLAVLCNKAC